MTEIPDGVSWLSQTTIDDDDELVVDAKSHLAAAAVKAAGAINDETAKGFEYLVLAWGPDEALPIIRRQLSYKLRQNTGILGVFEKIIRALAVDDNKQAQLYGLFGSGKGDK